MKILHFYLLFILLLFIGCEKSIDVEEITIDQIQTAYQNGDYTIEELVTAYLNRIEEIDRNGPELNSVIQINPDAIEIARELDIELQNGEIRGSMHGIPVLLKDNIDTHDKMNTTAGANALANSKPLQDAFIVKKLRESGAVIIGKTNLSEWANFHSNFSSSGWSAVGGQTKNPYDLSRNPCGSSAGSGVAVSANLCMIAIGTETNGSIVCPSNNNGIVGIKPTVGLLSRSGIVPISFTQDTPGPMARTVRDATICLGAMVGEDEADSKTSVAVGNSFIDYTQFLNENGLEGKRIAYLTLHEGVHFRVDELMDRAIEFMEGAGANVIEIDEISKVKLSEPAFNVLLYEFKHTLNEYFASLGDNAPVKSLTELIEVTFADEIETQYFDHELLKMAEEKGGLDSKEYVDNLEEMLWNSREGGIDRVMERYDLDAIVAPSGNPAWETDLTNGDNFGQSSSRHAARAGYPNVSVPMGFIDGLPVGMSIFGKAWSEPILLEIAYAFEKGTSVREKPNFKE
jgi:amidase